MTKPITESPYHCETCKKKHGNPKVETNGDSFYATKGGIMICEVDGKPIRFSIYLRSKTHGCTSHSDFQTEQQIRDEVMDEFGILHGEDAKRFRENMENPPPANDREKEMVKQAYEIIAKEKKEKENIIKNQVLDELDKIAFEGIKEKETGLGEKYCKKHPKQVDSCYHQLHKWVESLRENK